MKELDKLRMVKQSWLKSYDIYANKLCNAVLEIGKDDDMGDPDSIRRHHMIAKSVSDGTVTITATVRTGNFIPALKAYAEIKRLIVKSKQHTAAYLTITNDTDVGTDESKHNIFVPGLWMKYADQVIVQASTQKAQKYAEQESIEVGKLKKELLIGIAGFGDAYATKKGEENGTNLHETNTTHSGD